MQIYACANIHICKCTNIQGGDGDAPVAPPCRTRNGDTSVAEPSFATDVSPFRALCNVIRAVLKNEVSMFFFAHVRMYIFMATPLRASFPSWGPAVLPLCGLNSAGPLRAQACYVL